ncbi:MAG: hypothetical protein V8S72_01595 [Oscillospiraceae bacterium]|jgi:hypothetical protein|nr:MAG TPA: regulatory protein [Caudoviricetes sp.]
MSKFDLRKEIKIYSIKSGYSFDDIALKIGVSRSTFYNRLSCPDTFTIREFDTLANIIQMNSDDKMALLSALVA